MYTARSEWEEFLEQRKNKAALFLAAVLVSILVIALRLWHLQVIEHAALATRAESNRIREVILEGPRGKIFDRDGAPLVDSRPSFQLAVIPEDVENPEEALRQLAGRIEFEDDNPLEKIKKSRPFETVVLKRDIPREEVAFVEERRLDLPGVNLQVKPVRNYIHGDFAAHLLGYLGAIAPAQYEAQSDVYLRDDFVGQYGVERSFEERLRGVKGVKRVEVDAAGRELSVLGVAQPQSGAELRLSLHYATQAVAEQAFEGRSGGAVALDPRTGEVLALVSKPSFDPNAFAYGVSAKSWSALVTDEWRPLQNRVTQGQYPPGSTFKIVMAVAGLEEGVITPDTSIFCPGYFTFGNRSYRCWKKPGHGAVDVRQALIQSCDVFFYQVGRKLGIDKIAEYSRKFGLGLPSKIDLGGEESGLIPTQAWKQRVRKEPWLPGETISASIGQGYVLVTPLQQARMISAIANGGLLINPRLTGGAEQGARAPQRLEVRPETLRLVHEALRGVVNAPHGTAWRLRQSKYAYGGKTGTSQVVRLKRDGERGDEDIDIRHRDHAWFVAFGPTEDPRIAVAVIAEHSGHGGDVAAPIAQAIMDTYLDAALGPDYAHPAVAAATVPPSGEANDAD